MNLRCLQRCDRPWTPSLHQRRDSSCWRQKCVACFVDMNLACTFCVVWFFVEHIDDIAMLYSPVR